MKKEAGAQKQNDDEKKVQAMLILKQQIFKARKAALIKKIVAKMVKE